MYGKERIFMQVLDLFAGSCSFGNVARERGHDVITTDYKQNPDGTVDIVSDIFEFDYESLPRIDFVWASPPCTTFSIAGCRFHWNPPESDGTRIPRSAAAGEGLRMIEKTLEIIDYLGPAYWIMENPRGLLRKFNIVEHLPRETATYCQYGDERMKPTDLWSNLFFDVWTPKPMCKNGAPCHVSAPRGAQTGTQGIIGAYKRSMVPKELCEEIIVAVEEKGKL